MWYLKQLLSVTLLAMGVSISWSADNVVKVKEGDSAPEISLPATGEKKMLNLAELKGKKNVVLFFYPKAMTKGCTIESCGFRDVAKDFEALDTVIVGISIDKLSAQEEFVKKEKLNFPLLADDEMKVSKMLGVMADNGKVTKRITFVIDKEGKIAKIYDKVNPKEHPTEVLKFIRENLSKK